jgi:hypothetical protein
MRRKRVLGEGETVASKVMNLQSARRVGNFGQLSIYHFLCSRYVEIRQENTRKEAGAIPNFCWKT